MPVYSREREDGAVVITIEGRFDYTVHQHLWEAFAHYPKGSRHFVVDLAHADYMDSSAMGMLLQLREHNDGTQGEVELKNCNPTVREVLRIANFHRLFDVS